MATEKNNAINTNEAAKADEFSVNIGGESGKMSARLRVLITKQEGQMALNNLLTGEGSSVIIVPYFHCVASIHNPRAKAGKDTDYENFVIVGREVRRNDDGELVLDDLGRFVTGSPTFRKNFLELYDAMTGGNAPENGAYSPEPFAVVAYKQKNASSGRVFLTCNIADYLPTGERANDKPQSL